MNASRSLIVTLVLVILTTYARADIKVSEAPLHLSIRVEDPRWQRATAGGPGTSQPGAGQLLGDWSFARADGRARVKVVAQSLPGPDQTFKWRDRDKHLDLFVKNARLSLADLGADVTELSRGVSEHGFDCQFKLAGAGGMVWARYATATFSPKAASLYAVTYVLKGEPREADEAEARLVLGAMKIDLTSASKLFATKSDEWDEAQQTSVRGWRKLLPIGGVAVAILVLAWVVLRRKNRRGAAG